MTFYWEDLLESFYLSWRIEKYFVYKKEYSNNCYSQCKGPVIVSLLVSDISVWVGSVKEKKIYL